MVGVCSLGGNAACIILAVIERRAVSFGASTWLFRIPCKGSLADDSKSLLRHDALNGDAHATILRRTDHTAAALYGVGSSLDDEEKRYRSNAFRQNRQEGFSDSTVRVVLFLSRFCRRFQLAHCSQPALL